MRFSEKHFTNRTSNSKMRPVVFLDRDGVINEDTGYISSAEELHIYPFVRKCIDEIHDMGYLAIIITNQSGVARGICTEDTVKIINRVIIDKTGVDMVYYCPHHVDGIIPEYSIVCSCRKPSIGMIDKACRDYNIDMSLSYMVGDRLCDMKTGRAANIRTILVESKYANEWKDAMTLADTTVSDLIEAVEYIRKMQKSEYGYE